MSLGMLGGVKEQTEHGRRQPTPPHLSRRQQVALRRGAQLPERLLHGCVQLSHERRGIARVLVRRSLGAKRGEL